MDRKLSCGVRYAGEGLEITRDAVSAKSCLTPCVIILELKNIHEVNRITSVKIVFFITDEIKSYGLFVAGDTVLINLTPVTCSPIKKFAMSPVLYQPGLPGMSSEMIVPLILRFSKVRFLIPRASS